MQNYGCYSSERTHFSAIDPSSKAIPYSTPVLLRLTKRCERGYNNLPRYLDAAVTPASLGATVSSENSLIGIYASHSLNSASTWR